MCLNGICSLILIEPHTLWEPRACSLYNIKGRDRSPQLMYYSFTYSYNPESIEKIQAPIHFVALNLLHIFVIVAAWGRGP